MRRAILISLLALAACDDTRPLDGDAASPATPDASADATPDADTDGGVPDGAPDAMADASPDARSTVALTLRADHGRIDATPGDLACVGGPCSYDVPIGTTLTLTATADDGLVLVGWTGASCGTATPCTVTVTEDTTIEAMFAAPRVTVSATCTTGGRLLGALACGETTTAAVPGTLDLRADPAHGYRFDTWAGACAGTARHCPLTLDGTVDPVVVDARFTRQHAWSALIDGADVQEVYDVVVTPAGDTVTAAIDDLVASVTSRRSGAPAWTRRIASAGHVVIPQALAVTTTGDIVVAGHFSGTIDPGTGALESAGGYDAFLAAYAADGTPRWAMRWGGAGDDLALGAAALADGGLVVTGSFAGTFTVGGATLTADGESDGLAVRLDADHAIVTAVDLGGDRAQRAAAHDDVIAAILYAPGASVVRLDAALAPVWTRALDGEVASPYDETQAATVAVGADGRVVTAATRDESATVTVRSPDGAVIGERVFASVSVYDVAVAPDGDLLLAGETRGGGDVGGGPLQTAGFRDLLVARLGPAFEHRWSSVFGTGTGLFQTAAAIAAAPDGTVRFGGTTGGTIDLGGAVLGASDGDIDAFVAAFY